MNYKNKKIFITGTAGFIGFHLALFLLKKGWDVLGYDAITNYYDINLKKKRLEELTKFHNFTFIKGKLENKKLLDEVISKFKPKFVVHLAAQAGVRYSIENPKVYLESNIIGTFNLLEAIKETDLKHFLMASTSSVYGSNISLPFSEKQKSDNQLSFYAATKKTNEIMTHTFSYTNKIPITMFRFFTVYGPWGRPDMALFKFTKAILEHKPIQVFNYGKMKRDFTYIDDLIFSIFKLIRVIPNQSDKIKFDTLSNVAPWRVVNIGNKTSVNLLDYIKTIESELEIKAKKNFVEMQLGDVPSTLSDVRLLKNLIGFTPNTEIEKGVKKFIKWYKDFYK